MSACKHGVHSDDHGYAAVAHRRSYGEGVWAPMVDPYQSTQCEAYLSDGTVCGHVGTTFRQDDSSPWLCGAHTFDGARTVDRRTVRTEPVDGRIISRELRDVIVRALDRRNGDEALGYIIGAVQMMVGPQHRADIDAAWSAALDRWHGAPVEG